MSVEVEASEHPLIALSNVSQQVRQGELILRGISLSIGRGELVAIIGGSGTSSSAIRRLSWLSRTYLTAAPRARANTRSPLTELWLSAVSTRQGSTRPSTRSSSRLRIALNSPG